MRNCWTLANKENCQTSEGCSNNAPERVFITMGVGVVSVRVILMGVMSVPMVLMGAICLDVMFVVMVSMGVMFMGVMFMAMRRLVDFSLVMGSVATRGKLLAVHEYVK